MIPVHGDRTLRQARLDLADVDPQTFLRLARRAAYAEEAGGWVGTQYETALLAGAPDVGVLGLFACERLVGAMSWGEHHLPRGGVSGRIDLVVTEPDCRGGGIATALMGGFVMQSLQRHGDELVHLSVIAQHPAIAHIVGRWGFVAANCSAAPLHQVELTGPKRAAILGTIRADARERTSRLKMDCLKCKKHAWHQPWCVGEHELNRRVG